MTARGRAATAGIAALVAAIAISAFALPRSRRSAKEPARPPDAGLVVVLPFQTPRVQPALADLRDVIQELLASSFTGEGSPRAVRPTTVREALSRARGAAEDQVAARLEARLLLRGEVGGTSDRLSIEARLATVPGGSERARARVEGSADSLPYLVDRLVVRLLAMTTARDEAELAALSNTSLPALRAYLAGREAYRRGRLAEAADVYFERAAFLDSSFVLAVLGLAAIGELRGARGVDEWWKFDVVWRQRDRLSPADRALLMAHLGPHYPRPATLVERIAAAEAAAQAAPHRLEAWYMLGENLQRYGSFVGHPGWEAKTASAFGRALALDSTHAQTLDRLLLFAARTGDRKAVRRYADLYFAHNAEAESAEFLRWRAAVALDDRGALAAIRHRMPDMSQMSLQRIVMWSHEHGVGLEDGDRAADVLLRRGSATNERNVAMNRMVRVLLNRGRPTEAKQLLAEPERGFGPQQGVSVFDLRIYSALYWDGDTSDAAAAARQVGAFLSGSAPLPPDARDPRAALCALAHWRIAAGDFAGARAALAEMHRIGLPAARPQPAVTPACEVTAEALLARHERRSDAATALERLDSLLVAASNSRDVLYTAGNLVAARLFEARGDLRRALEVVRRRAWWNAFLSTQLQEEGRLAALNGDRAGAIRAYRHYLALRSNPEPHLRPQVERVRAELEWLERGGEPVRGRPVVIRR